MKKKILIIILGLVFGISSVKAADSKSYIDYPSNGTYSGKINVSGWIMSDTEISDIKAFIDDKQIDYNYERIEREDVNKVIKGYGNNPKPGFNGYINANNLNNGPHSLRLEFYSNNKIIETNNHTFNYEKKAKMYIDYPNSNISGNNLDIQGWIMSTDTNQTIKTYIDNNEVQINYNRVKREDVIKAITGYGDSTMNQKPGFNGSINISNNSSGSHNIKIEVFDSNGELITSSNKDFYYDKYKSTSYIDYPLEGSYSGTLIISGWVMSTASIDDIKIYIDNNLIDYKYNRIQRNDVIKAIKGYGENLNPGFEGKADISNIQDGNHKLKAEFYSNGEIVSKKEKTIKIEKKGKVYIDYPNTKVQGNKLDIKGWAMTNDAEYTIKTYIDDTEIETDYTRKTRSDVLKAIKDFGDKVTNPTPGFEGKIDVSNVTNGKHILKISILDKNNTIISSTSKVFNLDKYKSMMEIDEPIENYKLEGTILKLKGWFLSHAPNTSLKVLIDGQDISDFVKMETRKDVIKIYGKEFNKTNNDTVGFNFNAPINNIKDGNRVITFTIIDNQTGEVILMRNRTINIKKYKTKIEVDEPTENYKLDGTTLKLKGWFISTSKSKKLQILVNDNDISDKINYSERADVYNVYGKEYNFNKNDKVGYNALYDVTNIKDGNVNIRINVIDNTTNEVLKSFSRTIKLKKYKTYLDLNDPAVGITSIGTKLNLRGWFISTSKSKRLQILIDEEDISNNITYSERPDVYNVYGKEFDLNEHEQDGFNVTHDVSDLKDGNVKLTINVIDNTTNEIIGTFKRTTKIKKYDGMLTIDYPTRHNFSKTSTLTVQGWELSTLDNSIVKILIDNKEYEVIREEREDVFNVYPTLFGGREMNEKPGFTSSIFLNNISEGLHKIDIKLYSKLNELITEKSINILVYSNTYFGIDVSSHQGYIDWDQVGKSGIDFAILRLGYGSDFQDQDDVQFINYVNGCVKNKIPFGVYLYSYATDDNNVATSNSEAAHTIRILNSLTPKQKEILKLPVFIDMEEDKYTYLGIDKLTSIADNYCNIIQANGYKCGVYANKNWLNNHLNNNYLASKYDIWLAHYVDETDYKGIFQIWQYSSSGHLAGISSNGLDMNISFKKYW